VETRAALFHAPGEPFELAVIDLDDPREDEVVVRMAAVGICGTDLHQVKGEFRRPTPMVLGHEGAGVVEWVGSSVTALRPGDEVVLSWAPGCGGCAGCRRGRPATCRPLNVAIAAGTLPDGRTGMSYRGETVYRGTVTGCLADRVVVSEKAALPVRGVPLDQAALLGCAALTGVGAALHAAPVTAGASVLVVGAGAVGQFVAQGARIAGARTVLASDLSPARRERALALGATGAVAPEEVEEALAAAAPDGVDLAFDCVGTPETLATALGHVRDGGTAVAVGLPPAGLRFEVEPFELIRREKRLTGTLYGSVDPADALPELLEHVAAGRLELAGLVGERFGLDDIDDAVATGLEGSGGRVLVTFP
jgi:S-(hydroxymethyl)glutathione dehydrogenase / alcohol dehydrogenase